MYSAYVRCLSSAAEEMAESITDKECEYLMKKYDGMSLQQLLRDPSDEALLDYILHTKKQRETLKKYGSDTRRAELKFAAYLHLEASSKMFQELSANTFCKASGKTILKQAVRIHHRIIHPELASPLNFLQTRFSEISDCLEKINETLS